MVASTNMDDELHEMRTTLYRFTHGVVGLVLFLVAVALRLVAAVLPVDEFIKSLLSDLGGFLAAAIAIPFIYQRYLEEQSGRIIKRQFAQVLDDKLRGLGLENTRLRVFEGGRLQPGEKAQLFRDARHAVYEVGVSLNSFTGYFTQRPAHEFADHVTALLARGVAFHALLLDADGRAAQAYAAEQGDAEILTRMRGSREKLCQLGAAYASQGLPGTLTVWTYDHTPICEILLIDPDERDGRAYIAHYLPGVRRAENPVVQIHKQSNPVLFDRYHGVVQYLMQDAHRCTPSVAPTT